MTEESADRDEPSPATSVAQDRPFYFIVTLWGARFRDYFLEYCLPSLLSPGNIPALAGRRPVKVLIATLPDDWQAMKATSIFKLLERHAEPVFLEIPPCPDGLTGCQHMGVGHKLMSEMAHRDRALGVLITPDLMISDGTVQRLDWYARKNVEIVLVGALRFGEEPFLGNLRASGAIPVESRRDSGRPLAISSRDMVAAAVNGFHSETLSYEWDAHCVPVVFPACWWRVPGEEGVLIHSMSWAPLLLDYGAIDDHDMSAIKTWTIDGDYVHANFGLSHPFHVVQDSDEMFIGSWAPLSDRPHDLSPSPLFRHPALGKTVKRAMLRACYYSDVFDPLKRRIFFLPVRWHSQPLNEKWGGIERAAMADLLDFIEPPQGYAGMMADAGRARPQLAAWPFVRIGLKCIAALRRAYLVLDQVLSNRATVFRRLGEVLRGDRYALRRVFWRARAMGAQLLGRVWRESGPPPPDSLKPR